MKTIKAHFNASWLLCFILLCLIVLSILLLVFSTRPNHSQTNHLALTSTSVLSNTTKTPPVSRLAFPGAEGYGSLTPGGRFGHIIFVSNLYDTTDVDSPKYIGSFRWAVEQTWQENLSNPFNQRRIIVFKVGGLISLVDSLILKYPFTTIAGQTAPGDGITLKGNQIIIATHDVILRGIRVRVGDQEKPTCCLDGIAISTEFANSDVFNVVIDHCSISWAIDENISTWIDPNKPFTVHNITFQWNIISEGLHNSIHLDEGASVTNPHSMGAIFGQDGIDITVHHNIFAHNWGRNPRISGMANSEIINNLIYGWDDAAVELSKDKNITHILNNYFKADSKSRPVEISFSDHTNPESKVYISGNLTYDSRISDSLFISRYKIPETFKLADGLLFTPSSVTMNSAETAYENVLKFAGVIFPVRDIVDQRIINDIKEGMGRIIDSQNQVGGWPNYKGESYPDDADNDGIPTSWETSHGLNPNFNGDASTPNTLSPDGYSWIEEYVNSLIPIP